MNISIAQTSAGFSRGQTISLTAPDNDIAATTGETLGGASIQNDGSWNGKWTEIPIKELGSLAVKIPAASAAIIKLSAN